MQTSSLLQERASNEKRPHSRQKPTQQSFLHVKQRLDFYYLPNDFPIEMTFLLEKLLQKLDGQRESLAHKKQNERFQQYHQSTTQPKSDPQQRQDNVASQAVRHEMSKVIQENNRLHLQIITLKEQVSMLKHQSSKLTVNRSKAQNEMNVLHEISNNRERGLFDELQQVKYKYNELMDLVHNEDPSIEKKYLKRLLKNKHFEHGADLSTTQEVTQDKRKRGITLNGKASTGNQQKDNGFNFDVEFLKEKIANREKQIKRLQAKLQFDGLNMNRILKDFNDEKGRENVSKLQEKIRHLEKEYKQIKDQNSKMKRQGGDKQALRVELKKNQETIKKLTEQNRDLKRQNKETTFNEKNSNKNINRKFNKVSQENSSLVKGKIESESTIQQLQRNLECLELRNKQLEEYLGVERDERKYKEAQLERLMKQNDDSYVINQYERQKEQKVNFENRQKLESLQRDIEELNLLNNKLSQENELLKEAVSNLQRIQQELMRKNDSLTQSTFAGGYDRTVLEQNSDFTKQENTELRSRLASQTLKSQNTAQQVERKTALLQNFRKECEILKEENRMLSRVSSELNLIQQERDQLKVQNCSLRDALLSEKDTSLKINAKNLQLEGSFDRMNRDLLHVKDQYEILRKAQKENTKQLSVKIASLEEGNLIYIAKSEEKDLRIKNLQAQLIECTKKLSEAHRELNHLDETLHKQNIEKSRLERKYQQLLAESDILKQRQEKHSAVREIQMKSDIEKLYRESQNNKMLQNELQSQITELLDYKVKMEKDLRSSEESMAALKAEIINSQEKERLYELQIVELKRLAKFDAPAVE